MINELINYSSKGLIKNVPAELLTYLKNRRTNKFIASLINLLALKVLHNDIFELTYLPPWNSSNDTSLNYVNNTIVFIRTDTSYCNNFKILKDVANRAVDLSPIAEKIDKRNFPKLALNYNSDKTYFYISDQLIYISEINVLILNLSNSIPDDDVILDILHMFINKTNMIQRHNLSSNHFEKDFLINAITKKFSNNREEISRIVQKMYDEMKNKVFDLNNELRNRKQEYIKILENLNNLKFTLEHTDVDHQTNRLMELLEMNSVKERIETIGFLNTPGPSKTISLKLKPAPIQYINYTRLERSITNLKMSEERKNFIINNIDNFKNGKFAFFNPRIHINIDLNTLKHTFEFMGDTHNSYVNHHTTYGSQGCLGTFDLDFSEARINADLKKIILLLLQYLSSTTIGDSAGDYNIENMMIGEVETKKLIFLKKSVTKNITIEEFENANFKLS